MFGLGMTELLIILLVVVVIFGARRLPEIGGGLGKSIRNFRKGPRARIRVRRMRGNHLRSKRRR